ncbi:MAG: polysaccharide deacetylase family protein [Micrococcales bacterium]|nr:polysaccharide deacetylase family protein [Micrococcales bacterium]
MALTFDDGPGPYTGTLLNTLAAKGVKATFFVLGSRVAQFPDLAARTAAEGHALGSHAWSHQSLTSMPVEQAADEIDSTTVILIQTVGIGGPVLFRPPYGAFDEQVRLTLAERGQPVVLWDVDTEDWKNRDVGVTTHRAVAGASPGSIILMHDIHESTVAAVPGIIDHLQAAGYTLVTLPELLGPTEPGQVYRSR